MQDVRLVPSFINKQVELAVSVDDNRLIDRCAQVILCDELEFVGDGRP